jgi:hypothetical protein
MTLNTTVLIPLEHDWHSTLAGAQSINAVPRLPQWRAHATHDASLTRDFELEAVDFCVSYWLVLDSAPDGTRVSVNGNELGRAGTEGFRVDVTDWVALEDNHLRFQVEAGAEGAFEGVRLQGIPCE